MFTNNHTLLLKSPLHQLVLLWNNICPRVIDRIVSLQLQDERSVVDDGEIRFLKAEIQMVTNSKKEISAVAMACIEHNKRARLLRA